jgi:hypothetical protein
MTGLLRDLSYEFGRSWKIFSSCPRTFLEELRKVKKSQMLQDRDAEP